MRVKVLEVLATLKRAGAERMAVSLATHLDPVRFETRVVSLYDAFPGGFEPVLEERHIPTRHLGKRRGFDPRMVPRLYRELREFRPDILHSHSYVMRYTFPAGLAAGCPAMVHTVHNIARNETDWIGRCVHRVAYRKGVAAVAVGEEVARSFEAYYGFPPRATIPNGIDLSPYRAAAPPDAWRLAHGFRDTDRLAVSVARLEPQKNPVGLLEAFAQALGAHPEWRLLLAGDGSLRDETKQTAERLGLGERVRLLGVEGNVVELLRAADLFVLGSRWEGTPLAVMEAMAAGLPVVATAVGGVPGLVEHGVTGLLVPAGVPEKLAGAISTLALDPARRKAFGDAARTQAERFGVEAMVNAYAALFEELAGGRR
ncbi:MAG: glycosyltransferase [Bryobacterales bacterium]|nr:glycosyltransferase [Bryobacterales bacterium]